MLFSLTITSEHVFLDMQDDFFFFFGLSEDRNRVHLSETDLCDGNISS